MKRTARRLAGSLSAAVSRYFSSGASDSAAGISYRVLFSLAPLTVVLVSVFGLLLQNEDLKRDVINKIISALPVKSHNVTKAIEGIATPASAAGFLSLLVLIWAASGMMTAIRLGLERTMDIEEDRGVMRGKLVDLALVSATVVLVLASVGVGLITQLLNSLVAELARALGLQTKVAQDALSKLLALLLWTGTVLLIYRVVPAKRPRFADALAGALVTALLLLAISLAAGFVYSHATKWSFVYGSLTSVFIFLYSVYLFASAVLFGAAFATEWSRPTNRIPSLCSPRPPAGFADYPAGTRDRGRRSPVVGPRPDPYQNLSLQPRRVSGQRWVELSAAEHPRRGAHPLAVTPCQRFCGWQASQRADATIRRATARGLPVGDRRRCLGCRA